MSRRIFRDIEEALTREVRRITFHSKRTESLDVLQDLFDPFTGELVKAPVQPSFYDSSADANHIQYPHIFVKVLKTFEDKTTGRILPPYGQDACIRYVTNAPKSYGVVFSYSDGIISSVGNIFNTNTIKIAKIQVGYLLRILSGNNKGTYKIASVTPLVPGPHEIQVSNVLLDSLPETIFVASQRKVYFNSVDLSTVIVGDIYRDSLNADFTITAIDLDENTITLAGITEPSASSGSSIYRTGNVFRNTDLTSTNFLILDPTQEVTKRGQIATTSAIGKSPAIPIDAYYLVRIDSKERDTHIDILNRVWEEFNPPKTALPVVVRTVDSAEQLLTQDVATGGSNVVYVADNSSFNVNDDVFIFDDTFPSKSDYGFQTPFSAKIIEKIGISQIKLSTSAPDTFLASNNTKIVSNADFKLLMFNFVNHDTKDIEGAQYWVHEFTFWVQAWVERLETPADTSVITIIDSLAEELP